MSCQFNGHSRLKLKIQYRSPAINATFYGTYHGQFLLICHRDTVVLKGGLILTGNSMNICV